MGLLCCHNSAGLVSTSASLCRHLEPNRHFCGSLVHTMSQLSYSYNIKILFPHGINTNVQIHMCKIRECKDRSSYGLQIS